MPPTPDDALDRPATGETRRLVSYAQHGEDILLHRLFPDEHAGFYVDVGANHPTLHSVTRHFYDRGWRGINVEPVARVCEMLRADRPGDLNLQLALSDHDGAMTLYEPGESLGMSTLNADFAAGLRSDGYACVERTVAVTTLAGLCERSVGDRAIDFLKIDVEGHEAAVIRGGDWRRWRPRAVVVEATVTPDLWEPTLLAADYLLATADGVNRYYLRVEDADLLPRLAAPLWATDAFIPADEDEARRALEDQLAGAREGLEHARFAAWEARRLLELAEARERALRDELGRLQAIDDGRGRLERAAHRLSAGLRRLPFPATGGRAARRAG